MPGEGTAGEALPVVLGRISVLRTTVQAGALGIVPLAGHCKREERVVADNNVKAVKYGVGTADNKALAKSLVMAALTHSEIPYSVAAMMSEASARISTDGWREGIKEWQEETGVAGVILH